MIKDILEAAERNEVHLYLDGETLKYKSRTNGLPPELKEQIRGHRSEIIRYLRELTSAADQPFFQIPEIPRSGDSSSAPLSFSQQRLWFLDELEGGSANYNMPGAVRLRGAVDKDVLRRALKALMERHEILRTGFVYEGDAAIQCIEESVDVPIVEIDLSGFPEAARDSELMETLKREASTVFNLRSAPLLRFALVTMAPDHHVLAFNFHHIVFDAWSFGIVIRDFAKLYVGFSSGDEGSLAPLAIQFVDVARWQRDWMQGDVLNAHLGYWKAQMQSAPPIHGLPLDHPRPKYQGFQGAAVRSGFDEELTQRVNAHCQRQGVTQFMFLETAFALLVSRFSNDSDVVIGTPVAGRSHKNVEDLVGFFVNTLALRTRIDQEAGFDALLRANRTVILDAFTYQHLPFETLVESLQPERSLSYSPLFQVLFSLQNNEAQELSLPGVVLEPMQPAAITAKFDIELAAAQTGNVLDFSWVYNKELFDAETAERMAACFECLVDAALAEPDQPVSCLPIVPTEQQDRLLRQWSGGPTEYPRGKQIQDLFRAQAAATPERIAVVRLDESLTYGELDRRSERLARVLVDQGICRGSRVGLCALRRIDAIVAMLAILKTGAAYVPLDAAYPSDRIEYMLKDASVEAVLVHRELLEKLRLEDFRSLILDDEDLRTKIEGVEHMDAVRPESAPDDLANVIYTSGSTGLPKGVMVPHLGVVRLVCNPGYVEVDESSVVLHISSPSFDLSTFEVWVALLNGSRLVLYPERYIDPAVLNQQIETQDLNVILLTPSVFEEWSFEAPVSGPLKWVLVGGDVVSPVAVERAYQRNPRIQIVNAYGPTENTGITTCFLIPRGFPVNRAVPIGTPINGTWNYVLSPQGQLVPQGVVGELYTGGAGVARGYMNRAELTAEKFVRNPFNVDEAPVLYRTGDLVRYLPDGAIEYHGRADNQVKLRGFRIELGEIEAILAQCEGVRECVAVIRGTGGDKRIVVYYIAPDAGDEVAFRGGLAAALDARLPEFMLPSAYVCLSQFPLTPNGKVDRRALPEPAESGEAEYVAPAAGLETQIATVWQEVLGRSVSATANFFEVGGHSLQAMRVVSRLRQALGLELTVRALFEAPTVAGLAAVIGGAQGSRLAPIESVDRSGPLPLSWAQQRLWFINRLDQAAGVAYHIPLGLRLRGHLDRIALRRALDKIVGRHEALRTVFDLRDGHPAQIVTPADAGFLLNEHDLSNVPEPSRQKAVEEIGAQEALRPFDLAAGPLIRGQLVRLSDSDHVLFLTQHHIVSDAWSLGVLVREVVALYAAFCSGEPDPLPALPIQYGDYAVWQRQWLQDVALVEQTDFWCKQLKDGPELLELPTDRPRPPAQSFAGGTHSFLVDEGLADAVRAFSHRHGVTPFMMLLSTWAVLLSRLSGQTDIVIGTPVANRQRTEVESLIGFFVNTLALRIRLDDNPSVSTLLERVKQDLLGAYSHQDVPFEQVVEALRPSRSLSYSPVFQVMFAFNNTPQDATLALPGLTMEALSSTRATSHFDLSLSIADTDGPMQASFDFASALFDRATIERLAGQWLMLLRGMVVGDTRRVSALALLDDLARNQVVGEFNATQRPYRDCLLHQFFEEQTAAFPSSPAVQSDYEELDYGTLNGRANQLAHHLAALQFKPGGRIAVCVDRGAELVVAMLGILKAGGVYVPIDPSYPRDRIAYMVHDCGPAMLLTQQALIDRLAVPDGLGVLALDAVDLSALPEQNPDPVALGISADAPAYMIYTSGSTGVPKGVVNHHAGVGNVVQDNIHTFGISKGSQVLQFASYSFDASIWEITLALVGGATLHIPVRDRLAAGVPLVETLRERRITHAILTPAVLASLPVDCDLPSLEAVISCGDTLPPEVAAQWGARYPLFNAYGPSECAIVSTVYCYKPDSPGTVPIGRPVANARVYILDQMMQPVPIGVAGELYIGGAGVALGYFRRDALNAERFVADPFSSSPSSRLYRTGDVGRWRDDGTIEYLGRNDAQVKLRGFRIELGEVEAKVATIPGVRQAAVLLREDSLGDKRLVAYVVPEGGSVLVPAELRSHLAQQLPDFMLPSAFVPMEALPLNPNGKIDRRALPAPDMSALVRAHYQVPEGDVEKAIAEIWQELIGVSIVGRHDNFFELGGHSLLAVHFVSRLRDRLGMEPSLKDLFERPTPAGLAEVLTPRAVPPEFEVPPNGIMVDCRRITPNMLPLATLSLDEIDMLVDCVPGGVANVQDIYPLSALQDGILFQHLLHQEEDPYQLRMVMSFVDRTTLEEFLSALQQVIDRHDILRTSVHWEKLAKPVQVVRRNASLTVREHGTGTVEHLLDCTRSTKLRLDLTCAPLLEAHVIDDEGSGQVLMALVYHHLACDHIALALAVEEVRLLLEGNADRLPAPIPYRNFIAHSRDVREDEHEAYFRRVLGDVDEPTAPFGVIDVHGTHTIRAHHEALDERLSRRVRDAARARGLSAAVLFHVAWALVVSKCAGRDDVVFGSVLLGRMSGIANAESIMGMFINTLPVRVPLNGVPVESVIRGVQRQLAELMVHEQASLVLAQGCSALSPGVPLFSAIINYRHTSRADETQQNWQGGTLLSVDERTNFPMEMAVDDYGDGFGLTSRCASPVEPARVASYLTTALEGLLDAIDQQTETSACGINVIPPGERDLLVAQFNESNAPFPDDKLVHELFEERASRQPEATALTYENTHLSYVELNERANQLAHYLRILGVDKDVPVALCLERSLEMVIAIVAVNKAGGAYVPMDPDHPVERLDYMLRNTGARILIKQHRVLPGVAFDGVVSIEIDDAHTRLLLSDQSVNNIPANAAALDPSALAYVIHTSGSTGQPKGVMVEHRALVNRLHWMQKEYRLTPQDCVLQKTPYSFDVSVWEFWWPLIQGARLVCAIPGGHRDPAYLKNVIQEQNVTTLHFVPSMLASMLGNVAWGECTSVRQVFCSGEALDKRLVEEYWATNTKAELHNLYGPTEAAIDVSYWDCSAHRSVDTIPIGCPIDNIQLYVLDAQQRPSPLGVAGELYIGGVGLARGYFGNEGLTAEKFVSVELESPNGVRVLHRLYRTGDLSRWRPEGVIDYIGRVDNQVKINGLRIELGEIESNLMKLEGIREAVVLACESGTGGKQLVAYVVRNSSAPGDEGAAEVDERKMRYRQQLGLTLPDYMIPSVFVELECLPTTLNGKLDRKALPSPSVVDVQRRQYVAPRNAVEAELVRIWQGILDLTEVGVHDNYFELGGDSLKTVQIVSAAAKAGIRVTVGQVFKNPTIAQLASIVGARAFETRSTVTADGPSTVASSGDGDGRVAILDGRRDFTETDFRHFVRHLIARYPRLGIDRTAIAQPRGADPEPPAREHLRSIIGVEEQRTSSGVEAVATKVQSDIASGSGSPFRAVLFLSGAGAPNSVVLGIDGRLLSESEWESVRAKTKDVLASEDADSAA